MLEEQIESSQSPSARQKQERAVFEAELDDLRRLRKKAVEQARNDAGDDIIRGEFDKGALGTSLSRRQTIGQYRQYHKLLVKYKEFKQESKGLKSYPKLPEEREKEDTQQFQRLAELLREIRAGFEDIVRGFSSAPTGEVKARDEREDEKCAVFTKQRGRGRILEELGAADGVAEEARRCTQTLRR